MIEWLGPIICEYYAASEGPGTTFIDSADWLAHPGSVGRPLVGTPHILDDAGNELGAGEDGTIWFEGSGQFEYHGDPGETAKTRNQDGWVTVGDIGHLDADGFLYLSDRKAFMIISGGVNIYPQEIENALIGHPMVMDAAVFGVPNPDFGEEVKAVVQPVDWASRGPGLAEALLAHCRERIAGYKCPRSIDFMEELPRLDTGKLYKRPLRDKYWAPAG
jgi:acyl-CoA synthetase (AMP-forming)/AMP-acid ligase II